MRNLTVAGIAALTLVATAAQAAPASIRVADIDLNSTQGVATYNQRAERVARDVCRQASGYTHLRNTSCEAAVIAEATDKLAPAAQAQLARSKVYAAR